LFDVKYKRGQEYLFLYVQNEHLARIGCLVRGELKSSKSGTIVDLSGGDDYEVSPTVVEGRRSSVTIVDLTGGDDYEVSPTVGEGRRSSTTGEGVRSSTTGEGVRSSRTGEGGRSSTTGEGGRSSPGCAGDLHKSTT
ncbi:unnamed protein product, partial [Pylaiella littoralis]